LARAHVAQYRADAAAMPEDRVLDLLHDHEAGPDPAALLGAFPVGYPAVFRRLLALADAAGFPSLGLAVCDASGSMILRKSAEGFPLPLFGAACPLWPLYQALTRPHVPLKERLELPGRMPRRFDSYSYAETRSTGGFGGPVVARSYMLILPAADIGDAAPPVPVGSGCRICARPACPARREPSVIGLPE
jgi:predicted transcriptional regulator